MGTNTGLGIGIGIPFKNNALGGDKPYFPPELKARMIGVWTNYGKKNTDADRNIIKNKIPNAGGDLEILNAAYKLNSGFGEYSEDFTTWTKSSKITSVNSESFSFASNVIHSLLYYKSNIGKDIPSFKIRIKLDKKGGDLYYNYINSEGRFINTIITGEEYVTPVSYNTKYIGKTPVNCGFSVTNITSECSGTITQIPNFEDAFVSDGINDMIVSQKTLQEMGVTKGLTIVSMIHQINTNEGDFITTNNLRNADKVVGRNIVTNIDKTGIYGWYKENIEKENIGVINNILGDKADYVTNSSSSTNTNPITNSRFYVTGYAVENSFTELSSVAHYWTFAVLGKATEDEINLIIGNYNLDRSLKPDILCNIGKQGITNDNHAEFGDKLIDFSGNGRDIQLNNIAWKGDSGIGKYNFSNINIIANRFEGTVTTNKCHFTKKLTNTTNNFCDLVVISPNEPIKFKVSGLSDGRKLFVANKSGSGSNYNFDNGEHEVSLSFAEGVGQNNSFGVTGDIGDIDVTVEFIPSHAGALCLDGVNDFGKVTGMPVYKDYTIIADYERFYLEPITGGRASILSKSSKVGDGSFIFNLEDQDGGKACYTFVGANGNISDDITRIIRYQSKYYNTKTLSIGTAEDNDFMVLGKVREVDSRHFYGVIYSLMTFPYSMSEFLIERQLKKHKLGTLYPDMVEFRPVIKANNDYEIVYTAIIKPDNWQEISIGDYVTVGKSVAIQIKLNLPLEVTNVSSNSLADVSFYKEETGDNVYTIYGRLLDGKSPQKINITIDEYIRFEDIVQPYPAKFRFTDVDSGQVYDWGSKIKVGSTIKILSNVDIGNYLSDIYTINGYKYNGNIYSYNELKELTFLITNQPLEFASRKAYKLGGSEPKVILYPERLKLSNDTYKRLGYIPDLTGNGNHGVFNNLAFTEESGVNEDGSVHLDGVDDYINIPTLSKGGKQVLMKVNWSTLNGFIYDQRPASGDKTFGIFTQGDVIAYSQHNNGNTYIDGIINNNIIGSNLSKITHNIVATCDVDNSITPSIGKRSYSNSYFAQMALYAFMLFDEISTDDKIKELNTYIGITPKVTLPNYYWDNYGKKNTDANRGYIDEQVSLQKTGTSVNPLENFNISYEGMSGYNGYPVVLGANKTWETSNAVNYIYDINSTIVHITNVKHAANALLYSYVKRNGALANIKEIPAFRVTIKGLEGNSKLVYKYLATENATKESIVYLGNGIHKLPKSFVPTDALLDLTTDSLIGFAITPMIEGELVFDCDITIEILPEYENGLAYDGVSDFTNNKNIPIFTDFTAIIKRIDLDAKNDNSTIMFKGNKIYESSIGNGFILDYCYNSKNYVYSYGKLNQIERDDSKIIYLTPESYNGNPIIKGENEDNLGLVLGKYWKGIIYKNNSIFQNYLVTRN